MHMHRKSFALSLVLILLLTLAIFPAVQGQVFGQPDDHEHKASSIQVVDCVEELDKSTPHRLVLQIIDNVFHKWREYDVGNRGEFCIFLEEPEWRSLTAEEARELLTASRGWLQQLQKYPSEAATIVDPEDLPYREGLMPYIDESRPEWVDDIILREPNTAVYRSDYLKSNDAIALEYSNFANQSVEPISPQNVFGTDDRERVSFGACISYPWNTIGFVGVDWNIGSGTRGTGFLISPHTALTNAHILYSTSRGGWFNKLSFYPGQYQEYQGGPVYRPFGQRDAVNAGIPEGYVYYEDDLFLNNPYDFGAFFFESPFDGISTYMPLEFDFYPYYINLAGYPGVVRGETNSFAMWHSFGEVVGVWEHELDYLADASAGNSGSPVWVYNADTNISRVVGILAQGRQYFNTGPRLTHHNKTLIEEWMNWTPTVPVTSVSLNKESITLTEGESETLIATVLPTNATNKSITWSSSNNSVATVTSNGTVMAVVQGTAIVTVITEDGNKTASCIVQVIPEIEINVLSSNLSYGTVSGGGTYTYGDSVTVTASPNEGYRFVKWTEGSSVVSKSSSYTFTAQANRTLVANFKIKVNASRIFGHNRFTTAIQVSQEGWPSGADTVLLARADDFADALAGVPLAYHLDAPILLTATNQLHAATKEEIEGLEAEKVILLGGIAAISDNVKLELEAMGLTVERIAGAGRYDTAVEIAKRINNEGVDFNTAFIAVGTNFADALAASSYAAKRGEPILLTQTNRLPAATEDALLELGIVNTKVCGGEAVISQDVYSKLPNPERIYGNNRYETAVALANAFMPVETKHVCIATGLNFPDAIAGGVLAAKMNTGVLLVRGDRSEPNQVVQDFLEDRQITSVTLFGGTGAISNDMEEWF